MSTAYRCLAASVAATAFYLFTIPAAITPASACGEVVPFNGEASAGTIVVRTNERRLYLVLGQGRALAIRSASAAPDGSGLVVPPSTASTFGRPGRHRLTSRAGKRLWRGSCPEAVSKMSLPSPR